MSKRAYKTYTREFKVEAVRLAVGGELLICDKNQTVGCSALVRSSFSRTRYKSFTYYKPARKPNQPSSSWVRSADMPGSPTQKLLRFLPLTAPVRHSPADS